MQLRSAHPTGAIERTANRQRISTQPLLPQQVTGNSKQSDEYTPYPYHALDAQQIHTGYASLATWISKHRQVIMEGFSGVNWEALQQGLQAIFRQEGLSVSWTDVSTLQKTTTAIDTLVSPFLGASDSVWGTRCTLTLKDLFQEDQLNACQPDHGYDINIAFGSGAALLSWEAPIIYIDIPKNEVQYRMRAGSITNLGSETPTRAADMYKRFYFVDWPLLNAHKKETLTRTTIVADAQWEDTLSWILNKDLQEGLATLSRTVFRVRPWFEAGAWGGQWMKEQLDLNPAEVNYAWSFELIVPENGLVFESSGNLLEVSFDCLMFAQQQAVLGKQAALFRDEFPIRFDFLDTWEGGNLSIQCHPSLAYIREHFGEHITQDETYYILDCQEDATVYLGFQENIDPQTFRTALENSKENNTPVAITDFVQCLPARKHDLFLIPNGTVHSAGKNNVVLEISATPYIFTFKMYDWLRLDLNGEPRAINIDHAFNNLRFERKGDYVQDKLVSHPATLGKGLDWELIHLPTHEGHFYDVHRIEFDKEYTVQTNESVQVLMLVEGTSLTVEPLGGQAAIFHYAETFVVPAATGSFTLTNRGNSRAKVIKAFLKNNIIL